MNARNKLKTSDLMGINTHILYHAHRKNTEWGWGLSKKQTVVCVVRVVAIQIQLQGWGHQTHPPPACLGVRNNRVIYSRKPKIKVNSYKTQTPEYLIHTLLKKAQG